MVDTWNVTAAYDKSVYQQGETIRISISGDFVHSVQVEGQIGPGSFGVMAGSGQKTVISFGTALAQWMEDVSEDVVIDPEVPIVDQSGRMWTIAADGKSVTAVA